MANAIATVQTEQASRYLQQLCKHWAHRFAVTFTPEQGTIDFGDGTMLNLVADARQIHLTLTAEDDLAKMQDVVAEHLQRFAHKETLLFSWQPANKAA